VLLVVRRDKREKKAKKGEGRKVNKIKSKKLRSPGQRRDTRGGGEGQVKRKRKRKKINGVREEGAKEGMEGCEKLYEEKGQKKGDSG